ncbi:restriction endonuclease [Novosphingobium sp. ERN07]|uniref:BglII/BstYI family type II restriction endonuclease n=1 Tax=Novosphingobium sp. ERN07 TaxID=2726187 RepID=UPI0014576186|nr:BglII/BstYI family type II restriction endonuclease [Novosphingobium sp. ERN07]NLR71248.1 restriction endonuclease [Novosphingobium sp. ERN07]
MSGDDEFLDNDDDAIVDDGHDVSSGKAADHRSLVEASFPAEIARKFELYSYRNAASVLATSFPEQFASLLDGLTKFQISKKMIRTPGGSKGPIAKYVDTLFGEGDGWKEARIAADLHVKLMHAKKRDIILDQYVREGFLDGHRIDFLNGRVALDLEWNSKDQTYDRDLYAFSAFYEAGAIDVGVVLTRGSSLDTTFLKGLGKVLKKDGSEGEAEVFKKFGASTTWMGKLLYRLDAGRNGGCPVLAIGITPQCVVD